MQHYFCAQNTAVEQAWPGTRICRPQSGIATSGTRSPGTSLRDEHAPGAAPQRTAWRAGRRWRLLRRTTAGRCFVDDEPTPRGRSRLYAQRCGERRRTRRLDLSRRVSKTFLRAAGHPNRRTLGTVAVGQPPREDRRGASLGVWYLSLRWKGISMAEIKSRPSGFRRRRCYIGTVPLRRARGRS